MSLPNAPGVLPLALAVALVPGCGSEDEGGTSEPESAPATLSGSTGALGSETGEPDASSTTGSPDPGSTSGADTSTSSDEASDETAEATGGLEGACTPEGVFFFPQASIGFDFAGQSCTMLDAAGTDPQLVFDIRDTGLTDITAAGMSMQSSSTGTFVNPQAVVGISPDVETTVEATADADGSPVTIGFVIESKGPFLTAQVTFGGGR